jgi:SAM-dependent methyltransferase
VERNATLRWSAAVAVVVVAGVIALARFTRSSSDPRDAFPRDIDPEIPYIPTPQDVVEEMLRMAGVGKDDVVYDLGSGDGRIVITAAKRFGARGVGIDIDPRRVEDGNRFARTAGVTDRVRFIRGNFYEADLKDATVVTLYLSPSTNLRLRRKLLKELKPGTRVVSHNYHMGEWKPVDRKQVGDHELFVWIIPSQTSATPHRP